MNESVTPWFRRGFSSLWMLLLVVLVGCERPEPKPLTFRYQLFRPPVTLDPAKTSQTYSRGIIDRLFDGLMRLDRVRNVPETELAESITVSEDRLLYEFHLLPGARFHNERPIRADDFKVSWERVLAPESNSPNAWLFELIEGADTFRRGETESVSGIEVLDPLRLRVRLTAPFTPFLYHLADPAASVVPQEEVRRLGPDFGRRPIGSGPFRFQSWEENVRVELWAFDSHPRHQPQVERLIYEFVPDGNEALRRYQTGQLDLVSQLPTGSLRSLQQTHSSDLHLFPGTFWYGFCFRCDQPPFDDPRVRRAVALAFDRDALVRELGDQRRAASVGFLPRGIPGHDPATLKSGYDPERARTLLAEAGYPDGAGFPSQTYTRMTGEFGELRAKHLVAAFSRLGIAVESYTMDVDSLLKARSEGRLPFFYRAWGEKYPDPEPYFRPLFHSRGKENLSVYHNPDVDGLLDAARTEPDATKRRDLYRRAEALIIRDAPCVVFYQATEAILLRSRWKNIPVGYEPAHLEIELTRLVEEDS